tara:strand:+ start:925 stop:1284 length:360 start_codon:yes stop_codon:yes gene_type:complete
MPARAPHACKKNFKKLFWGAAGARRRGGAALFPRAALANSQYRQNPHKKRAGYRVGPVLRPNTSHGTARTAKSNTSKKFKFVSRRRKIYYFFLPADFLLHPTHLSKRRKKCLLKQLLQS